jgi:hypothetical protein
MFERIKAFFNFRSRQPYQLYNEESARKPESQIPGPARGEAAAIGIMQATAKPSSETEDALRRATAPNGERNDNNR